MLLLLRRDLRVLRVEIPPLRLTLERHGIPLLLLQRLYGLEVNAMVAFEWNGMVEPTADNQSRYPRRISITGGFIEMLVEASAT